MKRAGIILSLSILMFLMSFSVCFAAGLQLLDSYPRNGSDDSTLENVVVKLYFNEDVSAEEVQAANKGAFKFTDEEGNELPLRILYPKNKDEIWVLVNQRLESDSQYKLEISSDLRVPNGDTLGEDQTVEFKTRNTSTDTTVNMALMGIMMVGMIIFTSISTKRALKKEEAKKTEEQKINPYKVAKETGKPVETIVAKTEKQKQKAKARAERRNRKLASQDGKSEEEKNDNGNKRVKGPRPISAAGSTYVTGRKAKAEKERELAAAKAAAKAAAGTTRPKGTKGKNRNKKAKKRK
ncbi:MAG TPA: hypothetical protein GXZ70_03035 [Clostridiales bacterium]|jgi:hypothetical protein|nr:hypothetical protein [Clostridiales bacterium]